DDDFSPGFRGELNLTPAGCQARGKCNLGEDIFFTDPWRAVWKAPARDASWTDDIESGTTDGASIPRRAGPLVGRPSDQDDPLAAVVHAHHCSRGNLVPSWRDTHRMLYDAMRALDAPLVKAKIMYSAVYLRGPKWVELVPGE